MPDRLFHRATRRDAIRAWFDLPAAARIRRPPVLPTLPPWPLPGQILLITGPSGSGKSSLLGRYRALLPRRRAIDLCRLRIADRPVIDLFPHLSLPEALQLLSRVGLAEAHIYLLPPRLLSEGQRWRLRLALALARTVSGQSPPAHRVLLCDEFCSLLDPVTASVVCHALRRLAATWRLSAILATAHHELAPALRPDLTIRCDFGQFAISRA